MKLPATYGEERAGGNLFVVQASALPLATEGQAHREATCWVGKRRKLRTGVLPVCSPRFGVLPAL